MKNKKSIAKLLTKPNKSFILYKYNNGEEIIKWKLERSMLMQIELNKIQELLDWMKTKIYLNTKVEQANKRYVKRGQVYNCYFGIGVGNEIQKLRPGIVLQNNIGNSKSGNIIVAPITHTCKDIPSIVKITTQHNNDGRVLLDGFVNVSNILCVSKARLENYITTLSTTEMKQIDIAIAISLDLMRYYAKLKNNLDDKLNYIQKIKQEKNLAQNQIQELLNISNSSDFEELKIFLEKYRQLS